MGEEELRRAKDHLKGSLMLSLESTSSRMSNLARQEMYFGRFFTLDELVESIEAVSAGDVQRDRADVLRPQTDRPHGAGQPGRFQDRPRRPGLLNTCASNTDRRALGSRQARGPSMLLRASACQKLSEVHAWFNATCGSRSPEWPPSLR